MKKTTLLTLGSLSVFAGSLSAITVDVLDFDLSSDYSVSFTDTSAETTDYFRQTDGTDISAPTLVGLDGNFFAAQDIDGITNWDSTLPVTLTWTVDITGYTDLAFSIDFAEDDDGTNQDWDSTDDYVHITYAIDAGGDTNLIWLENDGTQFNAAPLIDSNFDGIGDGAEITNTFTTYGASITGTGASLVISVAISLNSGDEDIAFDNLTVTGTAVPEPSTYAALAGLFALGFVAYRRRK
jgi:hypothetical protein